MRYIDSGSRDASQTLGGWLQGELTPDVVELRWQSGYFSAEPLGLFASTLQRLASQDRPVGVLIGSNDPGTVRNDVFRLAHMLGLPRTHARLGVVQYANAFFHPKTYHLRRHDGSQCAYVGSANLTARGVTSLHVEAGILLDSRDGDPKDVLDSIAALIDDWFTANRDGLHVVTTPADVDRLVADDVLILTPPVRTPRPSPTSRSGASPGSAAAPRPRLGPLIILPTLPSSLQQQAVRVAPEPALVPTAPIVTPTPAVSAPTVPGLLAVNRAGFPQYVFVDPIATGPTSGTTALTGQSLPAGSAGLIIRLSHDDMRIFSGGPGTANISLPVDSVPTLRFGILGRGKYPTRPRAEFDLYVRYIGSGNVLALPDAVDTNVMIYGFMPEETGHQNTRMLLPADVRALGAQVLRAGLPPPAAGDLAILEWPTMAAPDFRLTFLEMKSPLAQAIQPLFNNAQQLVGAGACWLPPTVSPAW